MRIERKLIPEHVEETIFYQFEELGAEAKEKVRAWYLDGQDAETLRDDIREQLHIDFADSDLDVQFSLASRQGDGLNIYGDLLLEDAFQFVADKFTQKETRFFRWAFREYRPMYKMPQNRRYTYCIADRMDFCENLVDDLESDSMRGVPWDLVARFEKALQEYFSGLCAMWEEEGYRFFYEVEDAELAEICSCNGWEFYEDGAIA